MRTDFLEPTDFLQRIDFLKMTMTDPSELTITDFLVF